MNEFDVQRSSAGGVCVAAILMASCVSAPVASRAAEPGALSSAIGPKPSELANVSRVSASPAPSSANDVVAPAPFSSSSIPVVTSPADRHEPAHADDVLVMPWQPTPPPDPAAKYTELISPWQPSSIGNPVLKPVAVSVPSRDAVATRWRGGTVIPPLAKGATQCVLSAQSAPGKSVGYCVRVAQGPLVVTDLHASGSCAADLFALSGSIGEPAWVAFIPKGTATHVTGASLSVLAGADLIIGVSGSSDAKIARDLGCSLTWAGWASSPLPLDSWLEDRF